VREGICWHCFDTLEFGRPWWLIVLETLLSNLNGRFKVFLETLSWLVIATEDRYIFVHPIYVCFHCVLYMVHYNNYCTVFGVHVSCVWDSTVLVIIAMKAADGCRSYLLKLVKTIYSEFENKTVTENIARVSWRLANLHSVYECVVVHSIMK